MSFDGKIMKLTTILLLFFLQRIFFGERIKNHPESWSRFQILCTLKDRKSQAKMRNFGSKMTSFMKNCIFGYNAPNCMINIGFAIAFYADSEYDDHLLMKTPFPHRILASLTCRAGSRNPACCTIYNICLQKEIT